MTNFKLNLFVIILILGFSKPNNCFSQDNDTSKFHIRGFYIAGGVNTIQFYNTSYFDQINTATMVYPTSKLATKSTSEYEITSPYSYSKAIIGPDLYLGFSLYSDAKKYFNHVIEFGYLQFSGNYSFAYPFVLTDPYGYTVENNIDTFQYRYVHTAFSLGYKFQPTFKHFFLSIGMNFYYNQITLQQHKIEYINGATTPELDGNPQTHYYHDIYITDTTKETTYINFPIQIGLGGIIRWKCLEFRPAFYFSPCFMRGYNIYNLSLGIMYLRNKNY